MNPLSASLPWKLPGVIGLVALCATDPARGETFVNNSGPVGTDEPIVASVGDKRVIAFHRRDGQRCDLQAVVWDQTMAEVEQTVARLRVRLEPDQVVHIDTADNETVSLECGNDGKTLSLSDRDERVAFGMKRKEKTLHMNANTPGLLNGGPYDQQSPLGLA